MSELYPTTIGHPYTLGVHKKNEEHSFCIIAETDQPLILHIFFDNEKLTFPMHKTQNRYHIQIRNLPSQFSYAYEIQDFTQNDKKKLLVDPYCIALNSHYPFGSFEEASKPILGLHYEDKPFDWGNSANHKPKKENLIIYEMHIRGFTKNQSSQTAFPGTFSATKAKIPYLKSLGINAIEILPVMEFNECEIHFENPLTKEKLVNLWGYSTLSFFTIMKRYGSSSNPVDVAFEFKDFIKTCHQEGISVILDVVYNHTGEIHHLTDFKSYLHLAPSSYYILENGKQTNFTGCGNTFNSNNPIATQLIIDSMKYFVDTFHIDGFRFDLASIFMRDKTGTPTCHPQIIQAIQNDPVLNSLILISEPWDAAGLYHVGSFPKPFFEWNGWYRDVVRQFFNLGNSYVLDVMECLKGCPRLYSRYKSPFDSINFITCHDGFTLLDLVSYKEKHNECNGEENRDGNNHNLSENFGHEGKTTDSTINFIRKKQILNFFTFLFSSFGTPMIHMGDEIGHTKNGNNNTWCQDNELSYFCWDKIDQEILTAVKFLIKFRKSISFFHQENYQFLQSVHFLDSHGNTPDPHSYGNFIGMNFFDPNENCTYYFAYNASPNTFIIRLPKKTSSSKWQLCWNTHEYLAKKETSTISIENEYQVTGQTCLIAKLFDNS